MQTRLDYVKLPRSRKPRVLILGDNTKPRVPELAAELVDHLSAKAKVLEVDLKRHFAPVTSKPDLVLVLGGDGAILAASHRLGSRRSPVMGINFGSVGFLAGVAPERSMLILDEVIAGKGRIENRALMHVRIRRAGQDLLDTHILNDVVVTRAPGASMVDVGLWADRRPVCTYRGDGVIVSTATGSTAYALSAGGPILSPRLDAWLVTPIAPHMLGMRPLVLPGHRVATLQVNQSSEFTADGHEEFQLQAGDKIRVAPSRRRLPLIVDTEHLFYDRLRGKLHWAEAPTP
ncbi:MAG: NAD(+) kinase [Planctomycetes bacterium]|jgi:NAD+ kinase|nr:NAD(+) kinase [Planctomycetota bacterium]MBT4028842.1 NAD(+) kinase [Planctomycetota bacterium]MBT4559598.1 NAD(+) kinase [Planctomycetota bacterium]MBT7012351.1 NAD(+) kinase [Planctomycetota bacterium]MBT7318876.1 NAD(+) kinase [Planctomycetota bacterium]